MGMSNSLKYQAYILCIVVISSIYNFWIFKRSNKKKLRRNPRVIFLDTCYWIIALLVSIGMYESLHYSNLTNSYDLQNSITQFIGTILAIFFSLAIFPLQSLINNTSFSIVNRILRNEVFIKSLFLLIVIFLFVMAQYLFGTSIVINKIHYGYLIIAVVTFVIVIYEAFRLLDVKNVIDDYEREALSNLNYKWGEITNKTTDLNKQVQLMATIKVHLMNDTKILIEPIFVTTKKYIVLDQYDVVFKGLNSIVNIANQYIELFKYSVQDHDQLLIYLIERFKDLKDAVSDTTHSSIVPSLISATKLLALKSLEIETPMSAYHRSYLQLGLVSFLKEFVVSKELLKDTSSAPLDGIYALEEIGINAANRKNYNISKAALDALSEVSVKCTKLNFLYANAVSKEANRAIMNLHYHMLKNLDRFRLLDDMLVDSLVEPIEAFLEIGDDNPRKDNLSPFIGTGIDPANLFDPYGIRQFLTIPSLIFYAVENKEIKIDLLIDYLEELFTRLNQIVMRANEKNLFFITSEIVDTVYSICFTLLHFIENKKFKKLHKQTIRNLLDQRAFYIFSNAVSGSQESRKHDYYEKIESWVTVAGLYIVIFESWDGFPDNTISSLLKLGEETMGKATFIYEGKPHTDRGILHDVEVFYRYLSLCLYWDFSLLSNIRYRKQILEFIIKKRYLFEERYSSRDKYLPKSMIPVMGSWSIEQPYNPYYSGARDDFARLLSVYGPMKSKFIYEFMRRQELYMQIIELINFKTGKVTTYNLLED